MSENTAPQSATPSPAEATNQSLEQIGLPTHIEASKIGNLEVQLSDQEIGRSSQLFYQLAADTITNQGPQSVRLEKEEFSKAMTDGDTVGLVGITDAGDRVFIPILIPLRAVEESFDEEYHIQRFGYGADEERRVFYYTGLATAESLIGDLGKDEAADSMNNVGAIIFEEEASDEAVFSGLVSLLRKAEITFVEEQFIDPKNNSGAALKHYAGLVHRKTQDANDETDIARTSLVEAYELGVQNGTYEANPRNGVALLAPREFAASPELQDQLWGFCKDQFLRLIEDFPVVQEPSKEEFIAMLSDPATVHAVYFVEGAPVSSCVFLGSVEECTWLRADYFKQRYETAPMGYFPYLATNKQYEHSGYAQQLMNLLNELIYQSNQPFWVTFECTNVSADKVPGMVELVVNAHEELAVEIEKIADYKISALRLN